MGLLVPLLAVGTQLAAADSPSYTITDLGTPPGDSGSPYPTAINDAGQVAGYIVMVAHGNEDTHALRWKNRMATDLGTLAGGSYSGATSINDSGAVAGYGRTPGGQERALVWQNGTMADLGTLPGGTWSMANGINGGGQVVGWGTIAGGAGIYHALLWQDGTPTDLCVTSCTTFSVATAINDNGQVVGYDTSDSAGYALFWQNGTITQLPNPPGGRFSAAFGLNSAGSVVGYGTTAGGPTHALLWLGGAVTDLGVLPGGAYSEAVSINNHGQIVGQSGTSGGDAHAVLWQNGSMVDLNDVLRLGSGWTLVSASSINDRGQIVGYGTLHGHVAAFLLTPRTVAPRTHASLSGTMGTKGWYKAGSPVQLTLSATDNQGGPGVASTTYTVNGGAPQVYTGPVTFPDGVYTVGYFSTDRAGNVEATKTVSFKVDQTPPSVTYTGNARSYTVDQTVAIACKAQDNLSGIASTTCANISSPAYAFTVGANTVSAQATDQAGNVGAGSATFNVVVTAAGLDALIQRFDSEPGVATALIAHVDAIAAAPNSRAKAGELDAFTRLVRAQTGKSLTTDRAAILIHLVGAL